MSFCKTDILETLNRQVADQLSSGKSIAEVNKEFGEEVVDPFGKIAIPDSVIQKYWDMNKPSIIEADRIAEVADTIKNIAVNAGIVKVSDKIGYVDPAGKVVTRITDKAKAVYAKAFPGGKDRTAEEVAEDEIKKERGTQFHKDMENMFRMFLDPITGKKNYKTLAEKDAIDLSTFKPTLDATDRYRDEYVQMIAAYVKDKLDTYSDDVVFLLETVVYNKKENLAGTVDFIAVDKKGVDILDWKSMYKLSEDGRIYSTKKQSFNIQLNHYYQAIKSGADLTADEFNEIRVIPAVVKKDEQGQVYALSMGKVNPKDDPIGLLPVLNQNDIAFRGSMKEFSAAMNEIIKRENDRKARDKGFKHATDYELKQELDEAVTQVMVQQNPDQLFSFIDTILARATKYLKEVQDFTNKAKIINEEDIKTYPQKLRDASIAAKGLKNFIDFSEENLSAFMTSEESTNKINKYIQDIEKKNKEILKTNQEFMDKVARSKGITGITKAQVEIGFVKKWTTFLRSNPATKSVQLFSKLFGDVSDRATIEQEDAKHRILNLREDLGKWAKTNGKKLEEVYDSFINKSNFTLNAKTDWTAFRSARAEAFTNGTKDKFLAGNYDIEAYNKEAEKIVAEEIAFIDSQTYSTIVDKDNQEKTKKKDAVKKKYLITADTTIEQLENNSLLHIKDADSGEYKYFKDNNWNSEFYKDLQKHKEKLNFYNHISSLVKRAKDTGLVSDNLSNNFIPHILKGMVETGFDFKAQKERWVKTHGIRADADLRGNLDPISGLPVEKMYIPYTFDLSENVNGKRGFSSLSKDLSYLFGAFEQELIATENRQNLEDFFILLRDMEEANGVIEMNKFGNAKHTSDGTGLNILKRGKASNNYQYLDKFGKMIIYGQRIQDMRDVLIPTGLKDKEGNPIKISAVKLVQEMAGMARAGAFGGLNVVAPLRNFVMGRVSTIVQKSPYISSTISWKNYVAFVEEMKWTDKSHHSNLVTASVGYFFPNIMNKGAFLSKLDMFSRGAHILSPETMFKLMEKSEEAIRLPIHLALMDNSTVRNGEIVNINQLVKQEFKDKYNTADINKYIYSQPATQAKAIQREMDQRTKELIKNDNLYKYMELKDGHMEIKGVDRNSDSVKKIRNITANLASKATGTVNADNPSQVATSFIGRMLIMYRSWIPRTVQTRLGEFNNNELDGSYDEGRMRSLFISLTHRHENILKKLVSVLGGVVGIQNKQVTLDAIHKAYEAKAQKMIELNQIERISELSEEEFTQLYLNNIQAAYNDLRTTAALITLVWLSLLGGSGAGDDDTEKNIRRTLQRELAKYSQEFTFYYSPTSASDIIKSPFPILNYHTNLTSLFWESAKLTYNYDKAKPGKYLLKSFPPTNFFLSYLPLIDPELAKRWNLRINPSFSF